MGKIVTQDFHTHSAAQFVESVTEAANSTYYVFQGKHTSWSSEASPPTPNTSVANSFLYVWDTMISGVRVAPADIKHMTAANAWVTNTAYDMYDDGTDLTDKNYIVYVSDRSGYKDVFKCLDNNFGAYSTGAPSFTETAADDAVYIKTVDGYQWKWMYSYTDAQHSKFSTNTHIPIYANADVAANASGGAVDTILVIDPGQRYNAVANGNVKVANVAGNTYIQEIESLVQANVIHTAQTAAGANTTFVVERARFHYSANDDVVGYTYTDSGGDSATANIEGIITHVGTNYLTITDITGDANVSSNIYIKGVTTSVNAKVTAITNQTSTLSSNTDFYKNSAFFIKSGGGAGSLVKVSEYIVTGSARRVLLQNTIAGIDTTSKWEIGPLVELKGDGTGATGRAIVNAATSGIHKINIVNRGSSYTHANVIVTGNTGIGNVSIAFANTASCRAVMAPSGGHGANAISELDGRTIGISVDFANTIGSKISDENDFRQVGLIKDVLYANVKVSVANVTYSSGGTGTGASFRDEEVVTQNTTGATGIIKGRDSGTLFIANTKGIWVSTANATDSTYRIQGGQYANGVNAFGNSTVSPYYYSDNVGGTHLDSNKEKSHSDFTAFDNLLHLTDFTVTSNPEAYAEDETLSQSGTGYETAALDASTGVVHSINTTSNIMKVSNPRGSWLVTTAEEDYPVESSGGAAGTFTAKTDPDVVDGSGQVLYVENIQAVSRASNQTETIKFLIEF